MAIRRPVALHEADRDGRLGAPLPALAVRADGREVEVALSTARTRLGEDTLLIACVREARPAASAARQSLVAKEQSARREAQAARERARQLVSHALGAEDRERRRIAQVLHDEALQNLLVARQDLREVALGNKGALAFVEDALTRTIAQLRENLLDLSPASSGEDVASALRAVAEPLSRRAGFQWSISVDPDALGCHDQLVVSLAREWLNNAAKHSGGSKVQLTLARTGSAVVLEVVDNGRGIAAGGRERALRGGHFGLASSSTRLAALGGKLEILSAEGAGTRIRGVLPLPGPGCSEAVGADEVDARPHV